MIARELLQKLYKSEGLSTSQIAIRLKCSENKINYWMQKYAIQKRTIAEAMYGHHNPEGDPFVFKNPTSRDEIKLLGLGLGLYWGEGNKKNTSAVRLGNTDPRLIQKFIEFLVKIFGIKTQKLRFGLQVFSDMSKSQALNFWVDYLKDFGITKDQFFKVIITPARSIGTYREKSKFGVCTVYVCNIKLKKLIDSMLPL